MMYEDYPEFSIVGKRASKLLAVTGVKHRVRHGYALLCLCYVLCLYYEHHERNAIAQKKNPAESHFVCEENHFLYEATKGSANVVTKNMRIPAMVEGIRRFYPTTVVRYNRHTDGHDTQVFHKHG